jgi:hypothetical protein
VKIWLVMGSSGMYSDHAEWPCKAFTTEERANAYAESLPNVWKELLQPTDEDRQKAQEIYQHYLDRVGGGTWPAFPGAKPNVEMQSLLRAGNEMREKWDPGFGAGSDEPSWGVVEIDLED